MKRKSPDKLLEKHTKTWREVIDAFPYPVSIHDTNFTIVAANEAFIKQHSRKKDVIGQKCYELFHYHPKNRPVKNCPARVTLKKGAPKRSVVYEPATKKSRVVTTAPIIVKGKMIGIIHSSTDITRLKKTECDCRELVDIYASAVNDLKEKEQVFLRSKDAFFNMLEDVSETYKELETLFLSLIKAMVNALDAKSPWTKGHSENVAMYSEKIASEMGLERDIIKDLRLAGILHDIGKIGTYDYLLDKPGKLTDEEFEIVKKHPVQGVEIVKGIKQLKTIVPIIRYHHERIDGKGYPEGLKGDDIPIGSRILHVADSYDSMISDRPYRPAPTREYAISEFEKYSGSQFDPEVVKAFLKLLKSDKLRPAKEAD